MKIKNRYIELILDTKQHFQFRFLPYGFGYDKPTFIFSLFFFTLYLTFPFYLYETKDSNIEYCIKFYDLDDKHLLPDMLNLSFGKYNKDIEMPWLPRFFELKYDMKNISDLHLKDIDNKYYGKIFKYDGVITYYDNSNIECKYYREIYIFKYKLFKRFLEISPIKKYYLVIEYSNGTIDKIKSFENETCKEAFKRYCEDNKTIFYKEK